MAADIEVKVGLKQETCITCGCVFAMPEGLQIHLKENHQSFYCPVGHSMYYPNETDAEKLRKLYLKEQVKATQLQDELTRLINRVEKGVCPHCRRHFVNLERHIKTKHKEP